MHFTKEERKMLFQMTKNLEMGEKNINDFLSKKKGGPTSPASINQPPLLNGVLNGSPFGEFI